MHFRVRGGILESVRIGQLFKSFRGRGRRPKITNLPPSQPGLSPSGQVRGQIQARVDRTFRTKLDPHPNCNISNSIVHNIAMFADASTRQLTESKMLR
jgi:hypothetical protein